MSNRIQHFIQKMNKKDYKRFRNFLRSPYFFQKDWPLQLWNEVLEAQGKELDKTAVLARVFPAQVNKTEAVPNKFLNDRISDLIKAIKLYFQVEYLKSNDKFGGDALRLAYRERGMDDDYQKLLTKQLSITEKEKRQKSEQLYRHWQLSEEFFLSDQEVSPEVAKQGAEQMVNALDDLYLVIKLRNASELLARKYLSDEEHQNILLEEVIDIGKKRINNSLLIRLYIDLLDVVRDKDNVTKLAETTNFYFKNRFKLGIGERKIIVMRLANIAYHQTTTIDMNISKITFQLYKSGMEDYVLRSKSNINVRTYLNMANIGCAAMEYEWTEAFIKENAELLPTEYKQAAKNLAYAYVFLSQKKHKEVYEVLRDVNFTKIEYQLRSKSLRIRALYDILVTGEDMVDEMDNIKIAFRRYLNKLEETERYMAIKYFNFLDAIKTLVDFQFNNDKSKTNRSTICTKLRGVKPMANVKWLNEKINEIEAVSY